MTEQEDRNSAEDIKLRVEEIRRAAFEEESARIDQTTEQRAREVIEQVKSDRERAFREILESVTKERERAEAALLVREEQLCAALRVEREKKLQLRKTDDEQVHVRPENGQPKVEEDQRRRNEESEAHQAELSRKRSEEDERRRREEESRGRTDVERRRREEELRRQEEVRKVKEEEERKKREEQQRKKDEEARKTALEQERKQAELRQKEDEKRREEQEKSARIESQIASARSYFDAGDFEHALVEVAKALVNDPMNVEALDLEEKIKGAQGGEGAGMPAEVPEKVEKAPVMKPRPKAKLTRLRKKPTFALAQRLPFNPRSVVPLLIGLGVAALIGGAVFFIASKKPVPTTQQTFTVLPWGSATRSVEEDVLGSALAEEVTERLERITTPTVTGYFTSVGIAGHAPNPLHSTFQLGSMYALTGKVTRTGDTIAIALQLYDSVGRMAWSDGFMRSAALLSDLPDEISSRLADAINVPTADRTPAFTSGRSPRDGNAYQFYLRGLEMRHRRTQESQRNAYLLFEQAIQADARFAEAYAEAADILISGYEKGWASGDTTLERARKLAESAVGTDPSVSMGYIVLGKVFAMHRENREALAHIDNALKLSPHSSRAYLEKGKILLKTGRPKDAVDALTQAFKLNPKDPEILEVCGRAQQFLDAPRQGMAYHQAALPFVDDSTEYIVGPIADAVASDADLSLTFNGQVVSACERSIRSNPTDYVSMYRLARLKQLLGRWPEARELFAQLEDMLDETVQSHPRDSRALVGLALTMTRLGRFPDAIAYARRAIEADPLSASVKYGVAQMYSLQMYSGKKKDIDSKKKDEALKMLRQAVAAQYRLDELTNADFYNMHDLSEYGAIVQESSE